MNNSQIEKQLNDLIAQVISKQIGDPMHKAEWEEGVEFYHKYYDYVDDYMKSGKKSKEMIETNDLIKKVNEFAAKKAS